MTLGVYATQEPTKDGRGIASCLVPASQQYLERLPSVSLNQAIMQVLVNWRAENLNDDWLDSDVLRSLVLPDSSNTGDLD